jgi:hypothetical protein
MNSERLMVCNKGLDLFQSTAALVWTGLVKIRESEGSP